MQIAIKNVELATLEYQKAIYANSKLEGTFAEPQLEELRVTVVASTDQLLATVNGVPFVHDVDAKRSRTTLKATRDRYRKLLSANERAPGAISKIDLALARLRLERDELLAEVGSMQDR